MNDQKRRVCPVERSDGLDNKLRKWIQSPQKILHPYVRDKMTVLDVGCGPGFFSIEMAKMVGETGRVIACDLQSGMLQKLKTKITGTILEERIVLHPCRADKIDWKDPVDFVLAFYVVHEMPDLTSFFNDIKNILKPDGSMLLVEPPFLVSAKNFAKTVKCAQAVGFNHVGHPQIFLGRTALLLMERSSCNNAGNKFETATLSTNGGMPS